MEVKAVINKMKNDKAPGITGVTTNMLKNLPKEGFKFLTDIIQTNWDYPNIDFPSWHATKLTTLFKGKVLTHYPNNWRAICLKETSTKLLAVSLPIASSLYSNTMDAQPIWSHRMPRNCTLLTQSSHSADIMDMKPIPSLLA